jgi:hypothetical protein
MRRLRHSKMDKKYLVVVRAGDKSLHPQWIDDRTRNWDIAVSYFGDHPDRYRGQYDLLHEFKGSKWEGLADFMQANEAFVSKYEYVWFPDDDLFTDCENINLFFHLSAGLGFSISQPALTRYSHYSWDITLKDERTDYRVTDFVEIMAPCFSLKHFDHFRSTFSINTSGWGLEWLWSDIVKKNAELKMGIIDRTPVYHTRKVGIAAHGGAKGSPRAEMKQLCEEFNLMPTTPSVIEYGVVTMGA